MSKKYRIDDIKPSDIFLDSLSGYGVGSDTLQCGWCDRLHLCPDNEYIEMLDGTKEDYKKYCEEEKQNNPDGVVLHYDCDGVSAHDMNGIMFVIGCPCNGLGRYERFIWEHRDTIQNYLPLRAAQEQLWDEEEETLNKLVGIK